MSTHVSLFLRWSPRISRTSLIACSLCFSLIREFLKKLLSVIKVTNSFSCSSTVKKLYIHVWNTVLHWYDCNILHWTSGFYWFLEKYLEVRGADIQIFPMSNSVGKVGHFCHKGSPPPSLYIPPLIGKANRGRKKSFIHGWKSSMVFHTLWCPP
jgi:hypothetical protein